LLGRPEAGLGLSVRAGTARHAHHRVPANAHLNLASLEAVGLPPVIAPDPARTIRSQKAAQDPSDMSNALCIGR